MSSVDHLSRLPRGAHLCRFYDGDGDLAQGAAAFVAGGLAAGDRVLYVADGRGTAEVEASLTAHGVGAAPALGSEQLVILGSDEVYGDELPGFAVLEEGFRGLQAQARADGLAGLRVAAEMGDAAARFGSIDELVGWEATATRLQRETGISTVCQYDQRLFSGDDARLLAAEHGGTSPAALYPPMAGFYKENGGLRVVGELDVSNYEQLLEVLEARVAVQPRLSLDLASLSFTDVGTLEAILRLVDARPDVELTLLNTSASLRRYLAIGELSHPRVVLA
ncbi:MAG: hypothetical protein HOQ22_07620 [Nocardioidaceae bacterium]|nr:hypothetical protein [Nocardioidaceae bacterium]